MTYKQIFDGLEQTEIARRIGVVERMNLLWDRAQVCEDEGKKKRIDKQIRQIARQEQFWMKNVAFFLY